MKLLRLIPDDTKIPFMAWRVVTFPITIVLVAASLLSFAVLGFNYGIDFAGGTVIEVRSKSGAADPAKLRAALDALNVGETQVQSFGQPEDALIRIGDKEAGELAQQATVARVRAALQTDYEIRRTEVVGPRVSADLKRDAALAVAVTLLLILIYLWFRFEWQFAVGAVLTTMHDVVLTLGVLSVMQISFDLAIIAAILTMIGYSLNDTVVVYDRIRETMRKFKRMPLPEMIDLSINQTLSRTIVTSLTTFIAVAALLAFGGEALRGFNFTMLIGIVIGTYSSIVVAAPMLIYLKLRTGGGEPEKAQPPKSTAAKA
jgi:preprotein translocase SecF subunit